MRKPATCPAGRPPSDLTQRDGDAGDHGGGDRNLQPAQAEHQAAHDFRRSQESLQADAEKEKDDAEIGKLRHAFGVLDGEVAEPRHDILQGAESGGPEQHAGRQKAENGAELPLPEQRNDEAGSNQEQDDVAVVAGLDVGHSDAVRNGGRVPPRSGSRAIACCTRRSTAPYGTASDDDAATWSIMNRLYDTRDEMRSGIARRLCVNAPECRRVADLPATP